MIRLLQRVMHNRVGPAVESREIDAVHLAAVAPLVAVIVALGLYPHFVVDRTEDATTASIAPARELAEAIAAREDGEEEGARAEAVP